MKGLMGGTYVKVEKNYMLFLLFLLPGSLGLAIFMRCRRQLEGKSPDQEDRLDYKAKCTAVSRVIRSQSDPILTKGTLSNKNRKYFLRKAPEQDQK